jgi:hypothetical protein
VQGSEFELEYRDRSGKKGRKVGERGRMKEQQRSISEANYSTNLEVLPLDKVCLLWNFGIQIISLITEPSYYIFY